MSKLLEFFFWCRVLLRKVLVKILINLARFCNRLARLINHSTFGPLWVADKLIGVIIGVNARLQRDIEAKGG